MINNTSIEKWSRLKEKSLDSLFVNEIITGMNCSPFEAKAILDTVHTVYNDFFNNTETLAPGKAKFVVISTENGPSTKLKDAKKVNVTLTIDNGNDDLNVKRNGGVSALRQYRLQRICNEAFMQGGLLTIEDIANRIFCCGERTIVRDIQHLKKQNIILPLRSSIKDMGRTLSHRSEIIIKWTQGYEYSEIKRFTNHTIESISNYVHKFKQVVALTEDNYEVSTIAFIIKISIPLTQEYINIWKKADIIESRKQELENILKKVKSN